MNIDEARGLSQETLDRVVHAHTRTLDSLAGFERMTRDAEPGFRTVAARFRDLHRDHAAQLESILKANGRAPDEDGSFMSTVNRLVVGARAMFDKVDADAMGPIRDGERHVLDAYRQLEAASPPASLGALARNMREELEALLAEQPD